MLVKEQTTSDKEQTTSDKEQTTLDEELTNSDNVKFLCKTLYEDLLPDMDTNAKITLINHLPEILETAKKTKNWGFNFITGEIDIHDEDKTPENLENSS